MKKNKSNLDEMQEQKLLKIEHYGCWIAYVGLLAVIAAQMFIGGENIMRNLAGEWVVFLVLSFYLVIACLRSGIWDRRIKATTKNNFLMSLIAAVVIGILGYIVSFVNYHDRVGALATAIIMLVGCFVLVFAALCILMAIYKRRTAKIEESIDKEEDSE